MLSIRIIFHELGTGPPEFIFHRDISDSAYSSTAFSPVFEVENSEYLALLKCLTPSVRAEYNSDP